MEKKEMQQKYGLFNECLERFSGEGKTIPSYADICAMIGISPVSLDNLLYRELGLSGEEVVAAYRN